MTLSQNSTASFHYLPSIWRHVTETCDILSVPRHLQTTKHAVGCVAFRDVLKEIFRTPSSLPIASHATIFHSASHNKHCRRFFRILETTRSLRDTELVSILLIYQSISRGASYRVCLSWNRRHYSVLLLSPMDWSSSTGDARQTSRSQHKLSMTWGNLFHR